MNIQLGSVTIGDDSPCCIIAECCNNHMGDLATALEMATQAKRCGADIVKFQHHLPSDPRRYKYSLTVDEHRRAREHCDEIGIQWLCTPFGEKAVDDIADFSDGFKIGSAQSGDSQGIMRTHEIGKPLIYTLSEVYLTCSLLPIVCLVKDDLKELQRIADREEIIGFSDHSPNNYTAFAAVALGAKVIEKHVILDKSQVCADQYVSIDFNQLHDLVEGVRIIERNMND